MTFVGENLGTPKNAAKQAARDFEDGTVGAFSDIGTETRQVPALRYDNPNPNGAPYVKFDGYQELGNGIVELSSKTESIVSTEISTKEEALARIAGALRFKILGTNLEQGGKFSIIEAIGATRMEKIIGRRLSSSNIDGIDFIDSGNLGKIQLKGPFLNKNLQTLSLENQQNAIKNMLRKIQENTAPDTFIIDTLGLSDEVFSQLNIAVQSLPIQQAKKVRFIR
jgi:hypothetical protein